VKQEMQANLNVSRKGTLRMTRGKTKAIFMRGNTDTNINLVFSKNLTKAKRASWEKVARLVLLGPNYKSKDKVGVENEDDS